MSRVAIIPARGGSKRIPRKNIRTFCGKPMIAWPIEAALASECFDQVIVSTEDDEIAEVAVAWGASAPFRRPAALADDQTATLPVIAHAIRWLNDHGDAPELVCCLYATAPFVRAADLREAEQALMESTASYAFSVTSYAFPIQRALRIDSQKRVGMFHPEHAATRSQDLESAWHDAGQFYWGLSSAWLAEEPIFSERSVPIILPRHRVQDIDTPEDWQRAEWLLEAMNLDRKDLS